MSRILPSQLASRGPMPVPTIEEVRARVAWLDNHGGERAVQAMLALLSAMTNVHGYQRAIVQELADRLDSTNEAMSSEYYEIDSPWHGADVPKSEGKQSRLLLRRRDDKRIMDPLA